MNVQEKAKVELEKRVQRIEDLIAEKGIGSSYLKRAQKVQRDLNLALFVGGVITIAGLTTWALLRGSGDEE